MGNTAEGFQTFNEDCSALRAQQYPSRRLLQGARTAPPLVVRTVNRHTGREYWRVIKATGVFDRSGRLTMAVSVTVDITEIKRAELAQRLLAQCGEVLSSAQDHETTLRELTALMVPELADWSTVSLPDEEGVIRQVALAHADPAMVAFARECAARHPARLTDAGGAAEILRGGPSQLLADVPDELLENAVPDPEQLAMLRQIGLRSVVQVPIAVPGADPLGVLDLVHSDSGRAFTPRDLALAEELGRRAGVASSTRACTPSARTSRRRCRRGCCPASPGSRWPARTGPPTTAPTWAATSTTPSRCPAAG